MPDKILVVNGDSYGKAVKGLGDLTNNIIEFFKNPDQFKLVLFTGGSDVSPEYYNDTSPDNLCHCNSSRDREEWTVGLHAIEHGIRIAGICRGFQFVNVLAGGRLMHHIDHHAGGMHLMDTCFDETITVNSLHHQMVIPSRHSIVTGWSQTKLSINGYMGRNDMPEKYTDKEVEAAVFPSIKGFGVQYHPEMMQKKTKGYEFFHGMVSYALSSTWEDFVWLHLRGEKSCGAYGIST
jgi:gamma-glutamyl-gamma-aminobutyrate hydrolase PuuD